jgi:hypothetical protein
MPRRSGPPLQPATVRPGSSAPQLRLGDGAHHGDRCPLPPPARGDDSPSLPTARAPLVPALHVAKFAVLDAPLPLRAEDLRLDRPPRA